MAWETSDLTFSDLHSEIEQRCSSDILQVFKHSSLVCLYQLYCNCDLSDVSIVFKIIINQNMNIKIISSNYEYKDFEKLSSWMQLNELIEKYMQNESPFEEYDEITEELEQTIDNTEEFIEEELDMSEEIVPDCENQCKNCLIIFKNAIGLQHHLISCSSKKTVPKDCKTCGEKFSCNLKYRQHLKTHEKRLECPYCFKTFVNNGSLQRHVNAIHLKQKPHKCGICGKSFATSTMKNAHEKIHERNTEIQQYLSKDVNGIISYKCPNCNEIFDTSDHLKSHIDKNCYRPRKKRAYKYPCTHCGKQFVTKIQAAKHYLDEHSVIISNPQKFCFECNIEVEDYVNHIRLHSCQYKCSFCGTKFLTEETCRQHEISKHSVPEDRPFSCSFESCNASFKNEHHLKSHIASMHDQIERNFTCDICCNKFASKSLLTAHLRTHDKSGAIFSCKICGRAFKKLATLKNHSIALHQTNEIYGCDVDGCELRYKFLQDLKMHRQNVHGLNLNIQKYFHETYE